MESVTEERPQDMNCQIFFNIKTFLHAGRVLSPSDGSALYNKNDLTLSLPYFSQKSRFLTLKSDFWLSRR